MHSESRYLIVNADDLGLSETVNEGVFVAHEEGIVTSASLMVLREAAVIAVVAYPDLAVGLHLEAPPVANSAEQGRTAVEECAAQLERFRTLTGRAPTHLDSHKHAHELDPAFGAAAEALAAEIGVPLRNRSIRYEGSFFARDEHGG